MDKFWRVLKNGANLNDNLAIFYLILIAVGILIVFPMIIIIILAFTKEKLKKRSSVLLYAFMCGFFITMATFGFLKESLEISSVESMGFTNNNWIIYGWNILLVTSGLLLGLLFAWGVRSLMVKASKNKIAKDKTARVFLHTHDLTHDHEHEEKETTECEVSPDHLKDFKTEEEADEKGKHIYKTAAIILLMLHRIPEGFFIGYIISVIAAKELITSVSVAFLISSVFHLIPEQIIFYYRQREMNWSRKKSLWITFSSLLLFLPPMLVGAYSGKYIYDLWQVRAVVQSFIGGIFLFTSVIEFLPEFYHAHHDKKLFKSTLFLFMTGIVICVIILSFHVHGAGMR